MTTIDPSLASSLYTRPSVFGRIDTNKDGKVSKDEFVAGRPEQGSETKAADLYTKIDTDGTDALTEAQLDAGLKANRPTPDGARVKLAQDVISTLMRLLQSTDTSGASKEDRPPSAQDRFDAMDTDKDGAVSRSEFLAARPDGVSTDEAAQKFASIDAAGAGSITADQFAASMPKGPHGHHRHGAPPPSDDATAIADTGDTSGTSAPPAATSTANTALTAWMDAIKAYASFNKLALDTSSPLSISA